MDCSDTSNQRSRDEIIVKVIVTHATTLIALGHLCSLRGLSEGEGWLFNIIAFPLFPLTTAGNILYQINQSIIASRRFNTDRSFWRYHLAVALGVHLPIPAQGNSTRETSESAADGSTPLVDVDPHTLVWNAERRSWVWFGRMLVLVIFITQCLSAFMLYVRRLQYDAANNIDHQNGCVAFGGLIIGFVSLIIMAMNGSWERIIPTAANYVPVPEESPPDRNDSPSGTNKDAIDEFIGIDMIMKFLNAAIVHLIWLLFVRPYFFTMFSDYFSSSPVTVFENIRGTKDGENHILRAVSELFSVTILFLASLFIPVSLVSSFIPRRFGLSSLARYYPNLRRIAAWPAIVLSMSFSIAHMWLFLHNLVVFDCPRENSCEVCWKDSWADKMWTF